MYAQLCIEGYLLCCNKVSTRYFNSYFLLRLLKSPFVMMHLCIVSLYVTFHRNGVCQQTDGSLQLLLKACHHIRSSRTPGRLRSDVEAERCVVVRWPKSGKDRMCFSSEAQIRLSKSASSTPIRNCPEYRAVHASVNRLKWMKIRETYIKLTWSMRGLGRRTCFSVYNTNNSTVNMLLM